METLKEIINQGLFKIDKDNSDAIMKEFWAQSPERSQLHTTYHSLSLPLANISILLMKLNVFQKENKEEVNRKVWKGVEAIQHNCVIKEYFLFIFQLN